MSSCQAERSHGSPRRRRPSRSRFKQSYRADCGRSSSSPAGRPGRGAGPGANEWRCAEKRRARPPHVDRGCASVDHARQRGWSHVRGGRGLGCRLPPVKMSIRLTLGPRFFFLESHSDEMAIFRRRPPVGVCVKNALELWAASVACVDTFPLGCLPHARVPGGTGRCSRPLKLVVPDRRQTPHPQFGPCLLRALCVAPGSVQGSVRILPPLHSRCETSNIGPGLRSGASPVPTSECPGLTWAA